MILLSNINFKIYNVAIRVKRARKKPQGKNPPEDKISCG